MRNSRSFQGLCPLDPQEGSALPPGPQLKLAMTVGHCISCLRHDSPTSPTISHWPAQFCCTPPKNLITRPTDEPPIKNPPKNLLPAGVLLRGVSVEFIFTLNIIFISCQRLHYTVSVKRLNTAKDSFFV